MGNALLTCTAYKYFLHLELLPLLAFAQYLNIHEINAARQVSAAVVNVSGRQRMLSQRSALLCMQLVSTQNQQEQARLRSELSKVADLMVKSHDGLIYGNASLNLTGELSPTLRAMYFQPPLQLDLQIREYITQILALLQSEESQLTLANPHLQYILSAADKLLAAFDLVVSQYQQESDREQLALDIYQAELYEKSCITEQAAHDKAVQLEQALQELRQTQGQLIHNEKMSALGQLMAGVAHEINNPVNFITNNLGYACSYVKDLLRLVQLYQQECPQPSLRLQQELEEIDSDFVLEDLPKVLSSMKIGADRISELVRGLRSFARNDQSERKLMDIHEGIDNTLLILQNRLKYSTKHAAISIVKKYGDLPLLECYPGQLNQVFMNLISNAIDAVESQRKYTCFQPQIEIETCLIGDAIAISIKDNGSGMTKTVQQQVFDPFFTTKDIGKGTGLGLSISHQIIVEKHGGAIECISAPGQGTEFWIEIPLCQHMHVAAIPA